MTGGDVLEKDADRSPQHRHPSPRIPIPEKFHLKAGFLPNLTKRRLLRQFAIFNVSSRRQPGVYLFVPQ